MRLVVILAAHTPYKGALLERSCKRMGVEVVRYKEGEPWPNDYRVGKLVHGLECVLSLPNDVTHVMHLDSSDSLVLAGPLEIVGKFEAIRKAGDGKILIQGEKNCYPDKRLEQRYGPALSPWRFVNSGGWIAERVDAAIAMRRVADLSTYCDQRCWTHAYLNQVVPVEVDESCLIFQSMYLQERNEFTLSGGRLSNLKTGSTPCILHWNGTKNQGSPYSRDGVWACLNLEGSIPRNLEAGARA